MLVPKHDSVGHLRIGIGNWLIPVTHMGISMGHLRIRHVLMLLGHLIKSLNVKKAESTLTLWSA